MNMEKRCLIIDNENQSDEIEKLKRDCRPKGITIDCDQFNVGSTFDDELLTEGKIDIDKVVKAFKQRFKHKTYHLVAIDWDLSDPTIDGIELIRLLTHNHILSNTPKLLYTGLLEDKLGTKLDDFKAGTLHKNRLLVHLKTLIKVDIKDFVKRENYDKDIIRLISQSESMELMFQNELSKYSKENININYSNPDFERYTIEQIIELISDNSDKGFEFKKNLIELTIAHLISLEK
jgi:hypothetical protein